MAKIKVVIVEDDEILLGELVTFLNNKKIQVFPIKSSNQLLKLIEIRQDIDIFLIDINLPLISGVELTRIIRNKFLDIPIFMITALGDIDSKKISFENGANDYLVKPFDFEELYIRLISAIKRLRQTAISNKFTKGPISIDFEKHLVFREEKEIILTPKEFNLLTLLLDANEAYVSKDKIAKRLWTNNIEVNDNTIEVYINFLRRKIDKEFEKKLIQTKIGVGYALIF